MGRVVLVLALLVLGGLWAWDTFLRDRRPEGPSIRIATWNLRQFSAEREGIDYAAIAEIIERQGFDIVAIQEVKGDGASVELLLAALNRERSSTQAGGADAAAPVTAARWRAIVGSPTGNAERFAFVFDDGDVQALGTVELPGASILSIDRAPLAARFRCGAFDFTLVNVHLFFSDSARRQSEAAQLALVLRDAPEVPAGEGDVIVLGDFNAVGRSASGTLGPFLESGWQTLNDRPTNIGDTHRLDNLLIRRSASNREWTGRAGVVDLPRGEATMRRLSDHQPVWADFATALPDDDG